MLAPTEAVGPNSYDPDMPSSDHEAPLELLRLDPSLPHWVQTELLGQPSFDFARVRLYDPNVRPRTFQSDAMMVYDDSVGAALRCLVYEVQRSRDKNKLGTWKLYIGHMESEFKVSTALLIFVSDHAIANWYRDLIAKDTQSGAQLRPASSPLTTYLWSSTRRLPRLTRHGCCSP